MGRDRDARDDLVMTSRRDTTGERDWERLLGEVSRVVVITTSVLAAVAVVALLALVIVTFLGG
jgi:hypothetical protein